MEELGLWPLGVLLSSSLSGEMARLEIACPSLPWTSVVTFVSETVTSLPTGALVMPLLIRSSAPSGGEGMVKLVAKPWLVMREEEQGGGALVVFVAAPLWMRVTLRVLYCF